MIKFTRSSEEINSNGGFSFIHRLLDANPFISQWDSLCSPRYNSPFCTSMIVRANLLPCGKQAYMVANELRPGRQHSAKGAVEFLKRCVEIMLKAGYEAEELLVRVASGHDASDFIKALEEPGVHCLVKRNPRAEDLRQLLDSIRNDAETRTPRPGKKVFHGTRADRKPAKFAEDAHFGGFMVVEGVERTSLATWIPAHT